MEERSSRTLRHGFVAIAVTLMSTVHCAGESTPREKPTPRASSLAGLVIDDTGTPVGSATIVVDGHSALSAIDGTFRIDGVTEGGALIAVRADGYHPRVTAIALSPAGDRSRVEVIRLYPKAKGVELLFTGDAMFGRRFLDPRGDSSNVGALAVADDATTFARLVQHVAPLTRDATFTIPNVETVIATGGTPHPLKPFVIISPPNSTSALQALGVDVVSLANNHVYDFFQGGMIETLSGLHGAGFVTIGAGANEEEAYRTLVLENGGVRVGLAAFCGVTGRGEGDIPDEPPYFEAEGSKGGVARLVDSRVQAALAVLRPASDHVALIMHGGKEYVEDPTPRQQANAHKAIDAGADLVIAHHSHVLQPFELYQGKLIAYSIGDFIFDQDFHETWIGAMVRVHVGPSSMPIEDVTIEPIYLDGYVPYAPTGRLARHIIRHLGDLSATRGLTVVEEGSYGRLIFSAPKDLPVEEVTSEHAFSIDASGGGATMSIETDLPARAYLSRVEIPGASEVLVGRDVLRVGSFEDELADGMYAPITGWNPPSEAEQLVADDAKDGRLALAMCRDAGAHVPASTDSGGRHAIVPGRTYSLCGCWKGDDHVLAQAQIVFWDSLETDAEPIASMTAVDGTPPAAWSCFCRAVSPPPGTRFVNVRLQVADAKKIDGCRGMSGNHCAEFDALRLIEWERVPNGATLTTPNAFDFVRNDAKAESAAITIRRFL